MASKYWLKLYYELLDDPKIGRLTERLFQRFIQCLILAGENDKDGLLPSMEDISWRLRPIRIEDLETDFADLASAGLFHKGSDGWVVTNFAKRQRPIGDAERMRRFRERQQKQEYYEPVTYRNTDIDIDKESDIDTDAYHRRYNVTPPKTAKQAMNHPAFAPYLTATGNILPRDDKYINVVDAINLIAPRFQNEQELFAYLQPFYLDWMNRKRKDGEPYNKNNPAWLDWAIAGSIPSALQAEPQIFASETY